MRKALLSILAVGLMAVTGYSQSVNTTNPAVGMSTNLTGTIGVDGFLSQIWNTMVGQGLTNLSATIYGTYTPSLNKWGEGIVVLRNLPLGGGFGAGVGVGIDQYDNQWYGLTAQATLNATITPLAGWGGFWTNVLVTPFAGVALGSPFGSSTQGTSGDLETIVFTGASVHLFQALGANWGLDGIYGSRSGIGAASGVFYGAGVSAIWKF